MTNGDRIRSMSDRELVALFCEIRYGDYGMGSRLLDAMEESELTNWLKQEAQEEPKKERR